VRIYLAARYSRREELCQYRAELEELGHAITSRWLNGSHQIDKHVTPIGDHGEKLVEGDSGESSAQVDALRAHFATEDCADVASAGVVISFTEPPRSALGNRGGRHVEFGMAIALHKRLIVIGHRENLFHYLPQVEFYPDWPSCIKVIGGLKE
jgi:hypothetical protein